MGTWWRMRVPSLRALRVLLIWAGCALSGAAGCYRPAPGEPVELLVNPRAHEVLDVATLPRHFDWRNVEGTSFVTPVRNQQLPRLCGSCWAQAATGALSDRVLIASRGLGVAAAQLAPQVLLDLTDLPPNAGSCNGGDHHKAYEFIHQHGIADETCSPYQGADTATWGEQIEANARMCRVCDWNGTCRFTAEGPRWGVSEHGSVRGEAQMMAEIFARGPIACSVHARNTPFNTYTGNPEVLAIDTVYNDTTHVIVVQGWGETDDGLPYWIGRNSYGTLWGLDGFFKLRRGKNDLGMEAHTCSWAVPFRRDRPASASAATPASPPASASTSAASAAASSASAAAASSSSLARAAAEVRAGAQPAALLT